MVIASGHARAQLHRRRRVVERGRHPHRARFPLPLRRGGDQGRRHHHQYPRHRRLHGAGGIFRAVSRWCASACRIPTRRASRCIATTISAWRWRTRSPACAPAPGRSSAPSTASASAPATPRSRRSSWRCSVRNDVLPLLDQHRRHDADARLEARLRGHLVPGAVQQGDRRPERVRARERHPSGRHAQAHPDLRDHDCPRRRREADLAGDGQAFRPPRLRAQARRAGLSARRATSSKTPSCASRRWPTARSTSTTRTSRRWSTRRSRPRRIASSSSR